MQICKTLSELKQAIDNLKKNRKKIGFVPTMGALHEGHLSLYHRCKAECEVTVASIFVNPIQFTNAEDLTKYPRNEAQDLQMLESVGCDLVFMPSVTEMYATPSEIKISFGALETKLEGKFRPGHFSGVGVVVSKLFHLIAPGVAYFGQKDLQQYLIIKMMVEQLSFDLKVVCCDIMREPDGLAMSSRNLRIAHEHRASAANIYKSLLLAQSMLQTNSIDEIKESVNQFYSPNTPLVLEYFEIVDANSLESLVQITSNQKIAICVACQLGNVRLIDNILVSL